MAGNVRRKKFLDESAVQALLAATEGERLAVRDRALLGLLYGGALRVGEVARLDVRQILFDEGKVIVIGKRHRLRSVPVAGVVLAWILEYLGERRTGPVFLAEPGWPMSDRLIRKVVDKYAAKVDLPKISPHTLRHSAASHMLARKMYLHDLARFLGHRHVTTTAVYSHEVPRGPVDLGAEYRAVHPLAAPAP